jgi:hypothetical protein
LVKASGEMTVVTVPPGPVRVYVPPAAPPGVRVKLRPEQIVPLLMVIVGVIFTVILTTAVFDPAQLRELVPITE